MWEIKIYKMEQKKQETNNDGCVSSGYITQKFSATSVDGSEGLLLVKQPQVDPNGRNICEVVAKLEQIGFQVNDVYALPFQQGFKGPITEQTFQDYQVKETDLEASQDQPYLGYLLQLHKKDSGDSMSISVARDSNGELRDRFRYLIRWSATFKEKAALEKQILEILRTASFNYRPSDLIKVDPEEP